MAKGNGFILLYIKTVIGFEKINESLLLASALGQKWLKMAVDSRVSQ
jgi:hypothetical protein